MQLEHPVDAYQPAIKTAVRQGRFAIAALVATLLVRAVSIHTSITQYTLVEHARETQSVSIDDMNTMHAADDRAQLLVSCLIGLLVVTAVLFLRWLHTVAKTSQQMGARYSWVPKDIVTSFFIPVLNFKRPYTLVSEVHLALDPNALPEPTPQSIPDEHGNYRTVTTVEPARAGTISQASIGVWWITFLSGGLVSRLGAQFSVGSELEKFKTHIGFGIVTSGLVIVSAVYAILLVRALNARLQERFRRLRYADPSTLQAIQLGVPT